MAKRDQFLSGFFLLFIIRFHRPLWNGVEQQCTDKQRAAEKCYETNCNECDLQDNQRHVVYRFDETTERKSSQLVLDATTVGEHGAAGIFDNYRVTNPSFVDDSWSWLVVLATFRANIDEMKTANVFM